MAKSNVNWITGCSIAVPLILLELLLYPFAIGLKKIRERRLVV